MRRYPVVLPKPTDPRLHLAATITSLQVLGQVAFHFRVSIAQILLSLATCAVIEVAITLRKHQVLMWPASALLTGNGVAFILRVPGTRHGEWWSLRGWWIFVATAAVSLLSKHVVRVAGEHPFNPSNIGLVLCFLLLGRSRAEPLDFWWGPMSWWMGLALAIILTGGFAILSRLRLLRIAVAFWATFAVGVGALALAGHEMTARWHLGPIRGFDLWWVLVTSPEVLVFLFFMITDPKTAPRGPRARVAYAVAIGVLATVLFAPARTEWATKVALLGALTLVCLARPFAERVRLSRSRLALAGALALASLAAAIAFSSGPATSHAASPPPAALPTIRIVHSRGVQTQLTPAVARAIAHGFVAAVPRAANGLVAVRLAPGEGQDPPYAVVRFAGTDYRLNQTSAGWRLAQPARTAQVVARGAATRAGFALADVATRAGLRFREGAFKFGVTFDEPAMMGGGVCVLDYNGDGWPDLFVVNSYDDEHYAQYEEHGGVPTTRLFENVHGRFVDVTTRAHAGLAVRGEGCVAGDLDGDGRPDVYVTTATDDVLLWNNGNGTFSEGARKAGIVSFGWHSGAAIADVNGDGRPDLFVGGYADKQHPIESSLLGFPRNYPGVRDELFLNLGHRRFRDVGPQVGLDRPPYDHSLGAVFTDVNGDGRPDLYVANDLDPNRLYLNEPGGPLGFHLVEAGKRLGVADSNAGMGVASIPGALFVTNSRRQTHAAYTLHQGRFASARRIFTKALGPNLTGWGDTWADLNNDGRPDLALANGSIPVTSLKKDAQPVQVLAATATGYVRAGVAANTRWNARGLAAIDYDNDGRVDLVVNTIGGPLLLLHNTGPAAHWLEVDVRPFSPAAVVTVTDSSGRVQSREVQAGSSYLSSEDPRVHFGFGRATPRTLTVRWPDGTTKTVHAPKANAILAVSR